MTENKSFKITECKTGRTDCFFEFTSPCGKNWTGFEVSLHGAVALWEHFIDLGYSELEPKLEFAEWHPLLPKKRK